jgi:hypothetical protein
LIFFGAFFLDVRPIAAVSVWSFNFFGPSAVWVLFLVKQSAMSSPQRNALPNIVEQNEPSSPKPTLKGMDDKENSATTPGGSTPLSVRR